MSVNLRMAVQVMFVVPPTVGRYAIPCRRGNRLPDFPNPLQKWMFPVIRNRWRPVVAITNIRFGNLNIPFSRFFFPPSDRHHHLITILKIKRLRRLQNPVLISCLHRLNHRYETLYDAWSIDTSHSQSARRHEQAT